MILQKSRRTVHATVLFAILAISSLPAPAEAVSCVSWNQGPGRFAASLASGQRACFSFDAFLGDEIIISLENTGPTADLTGDVYDPNGFQVSAFPLFSRPGAGREAHACTPLVSGSYTLYIRAVNGGSAGYDVSIDTIFGDLSHGSVYLPFYEVDPLQGAFGVITFVWNAGLCRSF